MRTLCADAGVATIMLARAISPKLAFNILMSSRWCEGATRKRYNPFHSVEQYFPECVFRRGSPLTISTGPCEAVLAAMPDRQTAPHDERVQYGSRNPKSEAEFFPLQSPSMQSSSIYQPRRSQRVPCSRNCVGDWISYRCAMGLRSIEN